MLVHVQRQVGLLEAQEDIKSQVQEELGERQREMYLREQMKAIQKELGDDDQSKEITDLRDKLDALELPKEARAEVEREIGRLERAGRESMEAQVIRTYLEWIAELPWNTRSDDQLDLNHASAGARGGSLRPSDVKDRVLEFLAVRQLRAQQLAAEVEARVSSRAPRLADRKRRCDAVARSWRRTRTVRSPTRRKRRPARWRRVRSSFSSDLPASERRRSRNRSPARSAVSTSALRLVERATKRTSADTGARTSARCPAASFRE